jgi:hypothetical protein
MPIQQFGFVRQRPASVIAANIPRVVPDEPGGWFVIYRSHGWLYGSRRDALLAVRELTNEVRQ